MTLFTKTHKPTKKLTDTVQEIISIETEMKALKARADVLKTTLKESIEAVESGSINTDTFTVTYKKPTTKASIDSKSLKENDLETYKKYLKTSSVKSSVSVKAK